MSEYISRPYYGDVIRAIDNKIVAPVSNMDDPDFMAWVVWCDQGNIPDTDYSHPEEGLREAAKSARQTAVDSIKVTTSSGKIFDGDEVSQTRMARAILALQATNTPNTIWVLADNTPTKVTAAELIEALALAGAEQARLWVI